jgi:hypothetical protein
VLLHALTPKSKSYQSLRKQNLSDWQTDMISSLFLNFTHSEQGSRVSSGSTVSDYGLVDRAIGVRFPAKAEDFSSSLCVQTGSGAHPASCTMGTGGPFPGEKRGRGVMLTTHPHLVPRSWMSRSYTPLPSSASMACRGTALPSTLIFLL